MNPKQRISVCLEGTAKVFGVAWYGSINTLDLENQIKKVFNLPKTVKILLKDQEGDIIVFTEYLPLNQTYLVLIVGEENEEPTQRASMLTSPCLVPSQYYTTPSRPRTIVSSRASPATIQPQLYEKSTMPATAKSSRLVHQDQDSFRSKLAHIGICKDETRQAMMTNNTNEPY